MKTYKSISIEELNAYNPKGPTKSGKYNRYYCPFHGSDNQKSLSVNIETGYFQCFSCNVRGYITEYNSKSCNDKQQNEIKFNKSFNSSPITDSKLDLKKYLNQYQQVLPGSVAEEYLKNRHISLDIAQQYGLGFAANGKWEHRDNKGNYLRQSKYGRVVFPATDIYGNLVNLYGRSIELKGYSAEKSLKHDHLSSPKGIFNAQALNKDPIYICEGPFDALSLLSEGYNACAIFGLYGLKLNYIKANTVFVCFDSDQIEKKSLKDFCDSLICYGFTVNKLTKEFYKDCKDINEMHQKYGLIDINNYKTDLEKEESYDGWTVTINMASTTDALDIYMKLIEEYEPSKENINRLHKLYKKRYSMVSEITQ